MSFAPAFDAKEQVRQAVDIVDLVGSYVQLRRQGRNFVALCPWHDDSRPSLQVNPDRQSFKCWVCDYGGDVFSFIMRAEGLEFREALELLAERAGIELRKQLPNSEPGGPPPRPGLIALRVPHRATANALADVLRRAAYATAWPPVGRSTLSIQGAIAGVWDGGQLHDREADDLSAFCRRLANDGAPVVAMLDFPRRDRVDRALEMGVATVLGKPWLNVDLISTLQGIIERSKLARAA